MLLPREGAFNASEVRVRPSPVAEGAPGASPGSGAAVVLARGSDPYTALLDAANSLTDISGDSADETRAYILPLLDYASRMRYDAAIGASANGSAGNGNGATSPAAIAPAASASTSSNGKAAEGAGAAALEQLLHEGILVQAGPGCPAKPLMQAPGLRMCQGMAAPLGVRYSGMSVVYGTATGHVLAVMDTAAALKMAPSMRSSAGGSAAPLPSLPSSGGSGSGYGSYAYGLGGADSPAGVSAGLSAATSTTPSPAFSRASSCGAAMGDAAVAVASASPSAAADPDGKAAAAEALSGGASPAAPAMFPPLSVSGRSITASPVIQIVAAASVQEQQHQPTPVVVPTSAHAHVLVSFAIVGVKAASPRDGAVRCCRVMPASALSAAAPPQAATQAAGGAGSGTGLGVVVQVELSCASAGTLRLFLEGPEGGEGHGGKGHGGEAVRHVALDGVPAAWRHDATGCVLAVTLPAVPPTAASSRTVQVYL